MRAASLLLLVLAACSTWTSYETGPDSRPLVVEALRNADGEAILVSGDRGYLVKPTALRPEIDAFTDALADAVEQRPEPGPGVIGPPRAVPTDDVVAFPHVTRHLTLGRLGIKSIRQPDGATRYWASLERRENEYVFAVVAGTPEVDRAWDRLANRARARASATTDLLVISPDPDNYIRSIGIDLHGLGGG